MSIVKSMWTRAGLVLLVSFLCMPGAQALTPAGTVIKNQASATFKDNTGVQRTVTSNTVETLIQPVAGVLLTQDQSRMVTAGAQVVFPHVISNSGNSSDSFLLQANNLGGDGFNFSSMSFYTDADQNGVADSVTPISSTPTIAADSSFYFVAVAQVPAGLSGGDNGLLSLSATSNFDGSVSDTNTDTAVISSDSVIEVTKSINQLNGGSPSGSYTITLSYTNPTSSVATSVVLIDALPDGMTYVPGSGRWSQTGATILTDSNPGDAQGSGADTIEYCSYHASCSLLPESALDTDSSSTNQVTAILNQVNGGDSGTLVFQVNVDAGLSAGELKNTAEFRFDNGVGTTAVQLTNSVTFAVNQNVSVVANGVTTTSTDGVGEPVAIASTYQNQTIVFDNIIWNTGNGMDSFDISVDSATSTFPPGTVIQALQSDGLSPLLDSNGNGIPDTGPIAAGAYYRVLLRVRIPSEFSGDNAGVGFNVTASAVSIGDPAIANTILNHLGVVTASTVDLTNNAAVGNTGVMGEGSGPEVTAVESLSIDPGEAATFTLFINNTSAVADTYALSVSTDSTFAAVELPPGWRVEFMDADENPVGSTGLILPGEAVPITAIVSTPDSATSLTQSIFFRAQSPTTLATDIKHDEVVVKTISALSLEPDQSAQTEPGATQTYAHLLSNNGNTVVTDIDLVATNSLDGDGWTALVHHDVNNNGVLDASDPVVNQISSLGVGEITRLLIKVFAPANASFGAVNITTLTATWGGGTLSVVDQTTVNQGDMVIVKEQAVDNGCDNVLDSSYTVNSFSLAPGSNCVSYRLTATNSGTTTLFNAVIQDATPAFTRYQPSAVCSANPCIIVEPAGGATGVVSAEIASISPGESVQFTFAVVLD